MVNGATGAFAAVICTFIPMPDSPGGNGKGVELLFPSVMAAGMLMLVVWQLQLDRFVTMLPVPVMIGFCNGLAIVIGRSQLVSYHATLCSDGPFIEVGAGIRTQTSIAQPRPALSSAHGEPRF